MSGDNGKLKQAKVDDNGHLAVLKIGGVEHKVVNTCTVMEIIAHKLENGQEVRQVIAQEFLMTGHKGYLVKALTDAINTVMGAKKASNLVKGCTEAMFNKMRRGMGKAKGAFGKGRR